MKKSAAAAKKQKLTTLDQLVDKLGLVPDRIYGHLLFTVGTLVDNGKKELKTRAGQGFSKLMTQLNIPTGSEVSKLQERITKLEKRVTTDLSARVR